MNNKSHEVVIIGAATHSSLLNLGALMDVMDSSIVGVIVQEHVVQKLQTAVDIVYQRWL